MLPTQSATSIATSLSVILNMRSSTFKRKILSGINSGEYKPLGYPTGSEKYNQIKSLTEKSLGGQMTKCQRSRFALLIAGKRERSKDRAAAPVKAKARRDQNIYSVDALHPNGGLVANKIYKAK